MCLGACPHLRQQTTNPTNSDQRPRTHQHQRCLAHFQSNLNAAGQSNNQSGSSPTTYIALVPVAVTVVVPYRSGSGRCGLVVRSSDATCGQIIRGENVVGYLVPAYHKYCTQQAAKPSAYTTDTMDREPPRKRPAEPDWNWADQESTKNARTTPVREKENFGEAETNLSARTAAPPTNAVPSSASKNRHHDGMTATATNSGTATVSESNASNTSNNHHNNSATASVHENGSSMDRYSATASVHEIGAYKNYCTKSNSMATCNTNESANKAATGTTEDATITKTGMRRKDGNNVTAIATAVYPLCLCYCHGVMVEHFLLSFTKM